MYSCMKNQNIEHWFAVLGYFGLQRAGGVCLRVVIFFLLDDVKRNSSSKLKYFSGNINEKLCTLVKESWWEIQICTRSYRMGGLVRGVAIMRLRTLWMMP